MLTLGLFLIGLLALVAGAELLVRGASALALAAGLSPLVVGLTVVSMGTGAPEMAIAIGAARDGLPDLALGNVVGSNILNIWLILGLSALIVPLTVHRQVLRQEVLVMLAASLLLVGLAQDGLLSLGDGALLAGLMLAYLVFVLWQARRAAPPTQVEPTEQTEVLPAQGAWRAHWATQLLLIAAGLGLLVLGSDWLVSAAVTVARELGVSDLVIGLTIVAAGTSSPELATSIMAALRGQRDLAIGNAVGSNIFNILGCLGLTALLAPAGIPVAGAVLSFDLWVMLAAALTCLPVMFSGRVISRWEGAVLLAYYLAYTAYLVMRSQQSQALAGFSQLLSVILPLSFAALLASLWRRPGASAKPS